MRKTVARVALLLLALAAMLAFGDAVRASGVATGHTASIVGARFADDVHAIAAMPARTADWATTQQRGPQGNDQFVAALLAGSALVIARAWRRASHAPHRSRSALGAHRAASRAPPAFA